MTYHINVTYVMEKEGNTTETCTSVPMELQTAAAALRYRACDIRIRKILRALAAVQGYDPDTVVFESAELDTQLHPHLQAEDVIRKASTEACGMYMRIGDNQISMADAIEILSKAMGLQSPVEHTEVAIGRVLPAGHLETTMDFFRGQDDDEYPGLDIILKLNDGSAPIQMVHVEQNAVDERQPRAYLYHRGGDVAAYMDMPTISDNDFEANGAESTLTVAGGDPGCTLHVETSDASPYTSIH